MEATLVVRDLDLLLTLDPGSGAGPLGRVERAAVAFRGDQVCWLGPTAQAPTAPRVIDGTGCLALPGLVDCHTHTVWAGSRAREFEQRLAGADYTAILEAGGGIRSTVRATRAAGEDRLVALAAARLRNGLERGVTTAEVKSGYGLSVDAEERLLIAAARAGRVARVRVMPTFLGAHTVPEELRGDRDAYVRQVIEEQLPRCAPHARFVDAYVDRGAFTVDEGRAILAAGKAAGLGVRVHAEQVTHTGAARMAAELGALSADHLERVDAAGIEAMAAHGTIAVLLPGSMIWLRDVPPPVEALRAAGVRFAIASDLNPGTSPLGDLWAAATLAAVTMRLTVDEVIAGITAVAADSLGRPDLGRVRVGGPGDLVVVRPPPGEPAEPASLVQFLGAQRVEVVVAAGQVEVSDARVHA